MRRRWHVIADLCKERGLRVGAEIGVAEGRFTAALLALCPDVELWAIDDYAPGYKTWMGTQWSQAQQDANRSAFAGVLAANPARVRLIEKPSLEAAEALQDASLDFVFIDADHSYDGVVADIAAWSPKVRDGGWVTGHDFDHLKFPGVVRAVEESFANFFVRDDFTWMAQA